jgi:hypothetical protein
MSRHGLEWVYRLASEPRRWAIRYLKDNSRFVLKFLGQLLSEKTESFFPKTSRACSFPPARRAALFKIDAED